MSEHLSSAADDRAGAEHDLDGRDFDDIVKTVTSPSPARSFRVGLVLGVVLAVATALLIIQNGRSVAMEWLMVNFTAPLWLFLLASAVSGAIIALLGRPLWHRARAQARLRKDAARQLRTIDRP
ncbi:hypothetical protein Acor_79460 [Acrocarpospora corrugata]|uniref:Lipopolysaccharide assembly protein A domain-containing protein n=1 Tax=Acrocarpospora corrugata TaxID=35763 RepID=A0A5M3W9Y7_9ACTN|nr:LapA family protein [Acrocarpospora corrugata]GES05877.1 hypothetical protein Acor_79460 [Acrocarpospora corrugata]